MKKITNRVKQFKKENKIIFPTWQKLLHVAKKNNWKLIAFSKAERLIQEHDLKKYTERYRAFVYEYADEMGHIYLNHTLKIAESENEENEADEFAELLLSECRKSFVVASILTLTLVVAVCILKSPNITLKDGIKEQSTISTESPTEVVNEISSTEITTDPLTDVTEASTEEYTGHNENGETLYYVSSGGRKYHLKDCYQINPNNCTALSLEQIAKMGYAPCKTCKPDKED